ncbi:MAG: hypothetical protein P8Y67_02420 [Alphaproteobacteria bacterium]
MSARGEAASNGNFRKTATEGMAEMSEKFREMGGQVYVETPGE